MLIGTQRAGWRRIWLDFFEDQSIAWCHMPGGVATVLRTPRSLGPSWGCAGDSSCCRKLTDTQLIILSKSARREDGAAEVPERMNKAATAKVERA